MKPVLARLLVVAVAFSLTACAKIYEPTPKVVKVDDGWVITDTASLSSTLIRRPNSQFITCAEPPPDAAFDQGEAADLNISLISFGGQGKDAGGESESTQEVEMAGRTPAVLLSRELFFRACEFSQNHRLNKEEALKLYNRTLDIVEKNWAVEAAKTTVTIGDTVKVTEGENISATTTENASAPSSSSTSSTSSSSSTGTTTDGSSSDSTTSSFGN